MKTETTCCFAVGADYGSMDVFLFSPILSLQEVKKYYAYVGGETKMLSVLDRIVFILIPSEHRGTHINMLFYL